MSLSDTARSRAIASFTAESDVPPRSKKWSRLPIWSSRMPSTCAHAAARRRSVGVLGALGIRRRPRRALPASAVSAFRSILLFAVSGRLSRQWNADGTMYLGSDAPSRSRRSVDLDRPLAAVEGHQLLALVGPFGHHHRPVADTRDAQQRVLDLADLDPEATDLDLVVPTAEELQLAPGQPAAVVTAAVEPLARPVRVGP